MISDEERQAIYARAVGEYGAPAQMRQTQEECAELIVALSHYLRSASQPPDPDLALLVMEELADVQIMLDQMRTVFDAQQVDILKNQKLRRLQERLNMPQWPPRADHTGKIVEE